MGARNYVWPGHGTAGWDTGPSPSPGVKGIVNDVDSRVGVIEDSYVNAGAYGIDPTGTTDSTTGLAAAFTAAAGKVCVIPPGTYLTTADLTPPANTTIRGTGERRTTIKVTGTNRGFYVTEKANVTIEDLTVDMNQANTTDGGLTGNQQGIYFYASGGTGCPGARIRRVSVVNGHYYGIRAKADTTITMPLDIEIVDCTVTDCGTVGGTGAKGIYIQGATRSRIDRCTVERIGGYGIHNGVGADATIRSNVVKGCTNNHGIVVNTGLVGAVVTNNNVSGSAAASGQSQYGIVIGIDTVRFVVANNFCYGNDGGISIDVADADPTNYLDCNGSVTGNVCVYQTRGDGIHVNHAKNLSIVGNVSAFNPQVGVNVYGQHCLVQGNVVHDNGRHGVAFMEFGDATGCGPHFYGPNDTYGNNTVAGAYKDFFSDTLAHGAVQTFFEDPVNTVAASSTAQTLPGSPTATLHAITLTANCTITLPTPRAGRSFTVVLTQDGTGSRTVTWATPSGSIKWLPNGSVPVLTTTAGKVDVLTFLCHDGVNYLGFVGGLNG